MNFPLLFLTALLTSGVSWGFPTSAFVRFSHPSNQDLCIASSSAESSSTKIGAASNGLLSDYFSSECDDSNMPPSLSIITRSITQLLSGSDIRGRFVDHPRRGNMASVAQAISKSTLPALTPFAAHCLGYAFATMLKEKFSEGEEVVICIGRDPREHGTVVADSFGRGAEGVQNTRVVNTGIATTPAMFEFCR
jgi:hypothetical protein